jgi:hypothetical protein
MSPTSSTALPRDLNPIANYALELVSEFLAREKREYMLRNRWAKSGRDQLGKDLGEIETALCMSTKTASLAASTLLPIFLVLRRSFALPPSPLPPHITEAYLDILPSPPDPDDVPFREPTVQTTTAALYVNPRLDDHAALEVLEELIESEKDRNGASDLRILDLIDSVEKRVSRSSSVKR